MGRTTTRRSHSSRAASPTARNTTNEEPDQPGRPAAAESTAAPGRERARWTGRAPRVSSRRPDAIEERPCRTCASGRGAGAVVAARGPGRRTSCHCDGRRLDRVPGRPGGRRDPAESTVVARPAAPSSSRPLPVGLRGRPAARRARTPDCRSPGRAGRRSARGRGQRPRGRGGRRAGCGAVQGGHRQGAAASAATREDDQPDGPRQMASSRRRDRRSGRSAVGRPPGPGSVPLTVARPGGPRRRRRCAPRSARGRGRAPRPGAGRVRRARRSAGRPGWAAGDGVLLLVGGGQGRGVRAEGDAAPSSTASRPSVSSTRSSGSVRGPRLVRPALHEPVVRAGAPRAGRATSRTAEWSSSAMPIGRPSRVVGSGRASPRRDTRIGWRVPGQPQTARTAARGR